jgi:hypothetical protein
MAGREKELLRLYARLAEADRATLLSFAEFLAARSPAPGPVPAPMPVPRRDNETVVGAIKRLSATYPMLDKSKMLNETSTLVAQYSLQGRPAGEVIAELEVVFESHYRRLVGDDGEEKE